MNVALSAVIISILLIHPLIFYVSLFLGKYPKAAPQLCYALSAGMMNLTGSIYRT